MSQPPPYNPSNSFVSYSAGLPGFPGQQLDAEFSNVQKTTNATASNLGLLQRDDGALKNASVDFPQLSAGVLSAMAKGGIDTTTRDLTGSGYLAIPMSSTPNFGIFFSQGKPTVTAVDGSIDLDATGKLWLRSGGQWTQVGGTFVLG